MNIYNSRQRLEVELKKYTKYRYLYKSISYMGASNDVLDYIGISRATPLPFSLAHGVWPRGVSFGVDSVSVEPIHWSYNKYIHNSITHKPSLLLPHPWLLLNEYCLRRLGKQKLNKKGQTILVGLPPSRSNDELLYSVLCKNSLEPSTILIKPRGPYAQTSAAFWMEKGIRPVTARSYQDLRSILASYETILCPYFSSVLILAAAIDMSVILLGDVPYYAYEPPEKSFLSSEIAAQIRDGWIELVKASGDKTSLTQLALQILGSEFMRSPNSLAVYIFDFLSSTYAESDPNYLCTACPRGPLRSALYNSLAHLGLSSAGVHLLGFRPVAAQKINFISRILVERTAPLSCIRFPSINEFIAGGGQQVLFPVTPSFNRRAGFGASIS